VRQLLDDVYPHRRAILAALVATPVAWFIGASTLPHGIPPGQILRGLVFGLLYALTSVGLVLIYRANRVINFAQAEIGSVAAVVAIEMVLHGVPYFVAVPLGLVLAAVIGAGVERVIIRRFRTAPRLILAVATIGIAQILLGLSIIIPIVWEGKVAAHPFKTPFDIQFFVRPELFFGDHLMVLIVAPLAMVALGGFLRFSSYGIGIRAAAENADRARLLGIPVLRLSTMVWAIGGMLSALTAILHVPLVGFASFTGVSSAGNALLLRTLAAGVIGRMESLPRTALASIGIGLFEAIAAWNLRSTTIVDAMLVGVILVALLVQRDFFSRVSETGISSWKAIREIRPIPEELRALPEVRFARYGLVGVATIGAVGYPFIANTSQLEAAALVFIYGIVAVSLWVLTGWAGHISLGQFALVGFGGATTAVLYGRHGWDIFPAALAGIVIATLVALLIGLPALRIRGPFLAVTTLAFAVTSETYFLKSDYFPWLVERRIDRPFLLNRVSLQEPWQIYTLCLVSLLLVSAGVSALRKSHTGRVLVAVRDNEFAAEASGINTTRMKLMAFVISGAVAGFAGVLFVLQQKGFNTDSFNADSSLLLFSMVVIGGLGSLPGVILGAVYIRGVQFFLPPQYALLASGVGILFLLVFLPEGLGGLLYRVRDAYLRWVARRRDILVPSLVADRRVEESEEAQASVAIGSALGGLTNIERETADV
jgi:branched-chain amino acid transport system permease protein